MLATHLAVRRQHTSPAAHGVIGGRVDIGRVIRSSAIHAACVRASIDFSAAGGGMHTVWASAAARGARAAAGDSPTASGARGRRR